MTKSRDALRALFRVSNNHRGQLDLPLRAVFPRHMAPVARLAPDGEREIMARILELASAPSRYVPVRKNPAATIWLGLERGA